jgi:hypothetical protein
MRSVGAILAMMAVVCRLAVATLPIAPHIVITVDKNQEVLVPMPGYDKDGDKLTAHVISVPASGMLSQLTQVFSDYGYDPKRGTDVSSASAVSPVTVTGSGNRLVYNPPANTNPPTGKWAWFQYVVTDRTGTSEPGIVWLIPPHARISWSDFSLGIEDWSIVGNGPRAAAKPAGGLAYEPYSRGVLNHYIMGTESEINTARSSDASDLDRWYFQAPTKFHGNHAAAYGGALHFRVGAAAGDFGSSEVNTDTKLVVLECDSCDSGRGIRLARWASDDSAFDGSSQSKSIPLVESAWRKDPKNTLLSWEHPTQCEMVEVLSGLTQVQVLGDYTKWYETVALDSFGYTHGTSVPIACAHIYW